MASYVILQGRKPIVKSNTGSTLVEVYLKTFLSRGQLGVGQTIQFDNDLSLRRKGQSSYTLKYKGNVRYMARELSNALGLTSRQVSSDTCDIR